jgi:hypothetical protein
MYLLPSENILIGLIHLAFIILSTFALLTLCPPRLIVAFWTFEDFTVAPPWSSQLVKLM